MTPHALRLDLTVGVATPVDGISTRGRDVGNTEQVGSPTAASLGSLQCCREQREYGSSAEILDRDGVHNPKLLANVPQSKLVGRFKGSRPWLPEAMVQNQWREWMLTSLNVSQPAEKRAKILAAAADLFATQGYAETSVDDIGNAAGFSGPALYRHVANKQAMLDEICVSSFGVLLDQTKALLAENDTAANTLDRLIRMRIEFAYGPHGSSFAIRRANESRLSPQAGRTLAAMRDLYRSEWMRVLTQIRPTVSTLELQVAHYAAHTLIGYGTTSDGLRDKEEHKRHLERMALAVLLA